MKLFIQMQGLIPLAFCELCHRDPRPPGNDPGDLLFRNAFMDQAQILVLYLLLLGLQLLFQLRKPSVLELRRLIQVILLLGVLDLAVQALDLLTQAGKPVHRCLLVLPLGLLGGKGVMKLRQLLLEIRQPLLAQMVGFLL